MSLKLRNLLPLFAFLGLPVALGAQVHDPFLSRYSGWTGQDPREEIAWKVRLDSSGLSVYQRIGESILIQVEGRYLRQRPTAGDLVALLQVTDSAGRTYEDHSILEIQADRSDLRKGWFVLWRAFVLPGDYEVALALYDRVAGKHNFAKRSFHVGSLDKDPLPDSWSDLPAVEFLKSGGSDLDALFHPEVKSRLRLQAAASRPVHIEVLANLTGTGRAMVSHGAYNFNLTSLLPIVKIFSQIDVGKGHLNVELLDLVRRKVAYRQEDVQTLDWPRLRAAAIASDPGTVDVRALQDVRHTAAFLRREVAARLEAAGADEKAPPPQPEQNQSGLGAPAPPQPEQNQSGLGTPAQALVLISSNAFFRTLDDIDDTLLPQECHCLIYYIHYNAVTMRYRTSSPAFDNVKRVLKPLQVRIHYAESPQDLRRIMAEILSEISKL